MDPFVPIAFLIVAGIGIVSAIASRNNWKEVAAELGLEYSGFQHSMTGSIVGFPIEIKKHKHSIEVSLSPHGIPDSLRLNAEGILSNILSGRDIEVGCPNFDARTHISSRARNAEAKVSALLDYKTRQVVSRVVVNRGAKVAEGKIMLDTSMKIEGAVPLVREFVILAHHLQMNHSEIPGRLASNALRDPVSAVRLCNLTHLQQSYRNRPEAAETSRALLDSRQHPIRLAAAIFLGQEGRAVVREMALSDRVPTDLRIKALRNLSNGSKRKEMIEIATTLLSDYGMIRRTAIQCLGSLRHAPAINSLVALLGTGDIGTTLEIVKALQNIGEPSAETALTGLLGTVPNRAKTAVIEALGTLGTIKAVEPLHELTEQRRFRRPARVAIDSIQSRLGDVESGRLSLAPTIDPEGALSLAGAPEKAGGLSLDDEDNDPR